MKPYFPYPRVLMPVEIEAKMKLGEPDAMIARLRERGAVPTGQYVETNTFFDTEDRALLAVDEGLRVRVSKNVQTGEVTCKLTHKGPNRHSQLKSREETEMGVTSPEDARRLLECLGYVKCMSFQKRRQSWKLERCTIELDEIPRLGFFLEIEGPTEEAVMKVREMLGMAECTLIKASYIAMLTDYLQERGEPCGDLHLPTAPAVAVAKAG